MSEKKYLSDSKLSLYDSKLKAKMASDDASTLGSAKSYTDSELEGFASEMDEALGALASAVNGKAPSVHGHAISDVTGLQSELDGKSDADHTHTVDSALSTTSTNPVQNKIVNEAIKDAKSAGTTAQNQVSDHTSNKSNPHGVTKSQVGLGNVDNTADSAKPVSTAQATAIADAKKAGTDAQSAIDAHEALTNNPHSVTAAQVGLGNVPNVTTNNQKPTFTVASSLSALTSGNSLSTQFGKIAKAISDLIAHLANKSNPHEVTAAQVGADPAGSASAVQANLNTLNDEFDDHTENADIHFTAAERTKLSGIATGANKYTHPNSGVTAGTYKSVTVNAAGHVTGGTNPTTLAGYGITDAEPKGTATSTVGTHNTSSSAHNDIRTTLSELNTKVNNFLNVTDTTKDQLSEIIALIEANADDIETITSGKVNVADIVNNLTTNVTNKPLSAAQGVALKALVDALDSDKVDKVSGKGLSTNDYTTTEKNKLSGIAAGAEVNQNAFSNILVGTTTVAADAKTDTVEFVGSNVTITPDATNDKITFAVASGTTSAAGIVKLSTSTSSTSTSLAATPKAVKSAYDLANTAKTNAATAQTTADSASDAAAAAQSTADTATTNLANHVGSTSNPHGVTAAQVGLGNVPNVTTNNQTPTYTVASSNAELKSGETMTTAFGKIAKAVSSLIAHLSNTSNPHSVTKAQVGLGNVDNTADANKTVKAAGTATTATTLSGLTATVTELNILDGVTATTAELNYVDGVTSNIQTQLNGKAASSHGTHVTYSTTSPKANGTASAGSAANVSRGDHVHPLQTTVSGNAGTATKLKTARTITLSGDASGSVSFDGSENKTLTVTVADDSHNHVISNVDGLQAALDGKAATSEIPTVYTASQCTTFTSDSGTCTPLAVQNAAKKFAIPRITSTTNAIARYDGTAGEVKNSTILIEDVTNTKNSSLKAQVISIPAANGTKKMVYGYCTDQTDGTSFIGGLFDADATAFPYAEGLAIGGSSGNLLWKGVKVATATDIPSVPVKSVNGKTGAVSLSYTDIVGLQDALTEMQEQIDEASSSAGGAFDFDAYANAAGYSYSYDKSTMTETITYGGSTFATRTNTKGTNKWTVVTTCSSMGVNTTKVWTKTDSGWTAS